MTQPFLFYDSCLHYNMIPKFTFGIINFLSPRKILIFSNKKRITWVYLFGILLMCMSRNYLMVHYPTDVIVGAITGVLSSILGCYVTKLVYKFIDKNSNKRFCNFLLKADLMLIFNKISQITKNFVKNFQKKFKND